MIRYSDHTNTLLNKNMKVVSTNLTKKTMALYLTGVFISPSLTFLNTYTLSGLVRLQYSDNCHKQKHLVERSSEKDINKTPFPFNHNTLMSKV